MILQLMSKELNLDEEYIISVANNNNAYKKYKINKKMVIRETYIIQVKN